jgi:hypothetical protein
MSLQYHKEQHFSMFSNRNVDAISTLATPMKDLSNYPIVNGVKINHIPATRHL